MNRPSHIDINPRNPASPTPLPTPPESASRSPFENASMSPVQQRYSSYRKPSRGSGNWSSSIRNTSDDAKCFVMAEDVHPSKYMHFFDQLESELDVKGPTKSEHQVKQDPSAWEYELPEYMWPPIKENAKNLDASLKFRWGRENGYVQITNIGKALRIQNLKMSDFLKGFDDQIVRIRGGQIEVQGSWIPYDLARKVCIEKCYSIREYLAPMFGPSFVEECIPTPVEDDTIKRARPGRRPNPPPLIAKRPSNELDDEPETLVTRRSERTQSPNKRRVLDRPCASGKKIPPAPSSELNMDEYNFKLEDIPDALSTARELMRMQHCPLDGVPHNDWPMPGDARLGAYITFNGRRYKWNGAAELVPKFVKPTQTTTLPSVADMVQTPPPRFGGRLPPTPSPQQTPFIPELQSPFSSAAGRSYVSPPLSLRESFSERHHSVIATDECCTPIQLEYTGPLFPTPQPEGKYYEGRYLERFENDY